MKWGKYQVMTLDTDISWSLKKTQSAASTMCIDLNGFDKKF